MPIEYWKISDFAKKLDKHNNTVDGWFRQLETDRKIHYITRVNGEKAYDKLDLKIAQFIINRRDSKWSLSAIFDELPNQFELRPFPNDFPYKEESIQSDHMDSMKNTVIKEVESAVKEIAATEVEEQIKEIHSLLPTREQERLDRINAIMTERKITNVLEEEAIARWNEKSEEERMIKTGWFRKEEDKDKREKFIKEYVDENFESLLKKDFDIE